jgi:hypothetical protein
LIVLFSWQPAQVFTGIGEIGQKLTAIAHFYLINSPRYDSDIIAKGARQSGGQVDALVGPPRSFSIREDYGDSSKTSIQHLQAFL